MQITDKSKLLRALITSTSKEIILEFVNCYLNIYCLGNTYFTKVETLQVATSNKFTGYLVLNKNSEVVNIIKDCCSKKSSTLEFKVDLNGNSYLYYKRTTKDEEAVIDLNLLTIKPEQLVKYLDIINAEEFDNEALLTYEQYSSKLDTKYEFEAVTLNNILISNKDLELIPKIFDVEHNKVITLKPGIDTTNLKKKEVEAIKSNADNVVVTYEDLILSYSNKLIQISNVECDTYFYCFRVFKLNERS
jgi:hypothetical protein